MKKQVVFLTALSSLMFLSGCNGSAEWKSEKEAMQHEIDSLQELLETYKSKYGELATLDVANKKFGIWETGFYVDDFGEKTSVGFVHAETIGVFSNSATTNSNLGVGILVDKNSVRIQLFEYARNHPIKDEGMILFKAKRSDGAIMSFSTDNNERGDNTVWKDYTEELIDFLDTGGEVIFVAETMGSPKSEYKFKLTDTSYLRKALESL